MTRANECKKTAAIILRGCGVNYDRLTAREVGFEDLARASRVFVKVHGIKPGGAPNLACATARDHGFTLQVD